MSGPTPTDCISVALQEYQSTISPQQRKDFLTLKPDTAAISVLAFTAEIDSLTQRRNSRCIASRLQGTLQSVQQFVSIVSTFVSSHPAIAALVWGSMRLTILAATNFTGFFDSMSKWFMKMQDCCPRFKEYQLLFPDSDRLQEALCEFYACLVRFCTNAVAAMNRSGFFQLAKSFFVPFDTEFKEFAEQLQRKSETVNAEILLASNVAADQERRLQLAERKQAAAHRRSSQAFRMNAEKLSTEEQTWRQQVQKREAIAKKERLLEKLSSYDNISVLKRERKKRFGNTGSWLQSTMQFQSWYEAEESSTFWLTGILGSGKTVVTTSVIDDMLMRHSGRQCRLCFFYCQHDVAVSLQADVVLRSLLRQCLTVDDLVESYETKVALFLDQQFSFGSLTEVFLALLSSSSTAFHIFLDGLDELDQPNRRQILDVLYHLLSSSRGSTKLFLSSRDSIMPEMKSFSMHDLWHQSMECEEARADIAAFIDLVVEQKRKQTYVEGGFGVGDQALYNEIKKALLRGAQGMFLWVHFQIEDIAQLDTDEEIISALKQLPKDLPATYERLLGKVLAHGKENLVEKVLSWVAIAQRPMTLMELREAISIKADQKRIDRNRMINDINSIIRWSFNLLTLDEENFVVQFAHYTVKEHLLRSRPLNNQLERFAFDEKTLNTYAAMTCCTYLQLSDFERQIVPSKLHRLRMEPKQIVNTVFNTNSDPRFAKSWAALERFWRSRELKASPSCLAHLQRLADPDSQAGLDSLPHNYPFLAYASEYWLLHARSLSPENDEATYRKLKNLIHAGNAVAILPFSVDEWDTLTEAACNYMVQQDHQALLSMLLERLHNVPSEVDRTTHTRVVMILEALIARSLDQSFILLAHGCNDLTSTECLEMLQIALPHGNVRIAAWILRYPMKIINQTLYDKLLNDPQSLRWTAAFHGDIDLDRSSETLDTAEKALKISLHNGPISVLSALLIQQRQQGRPRLLFLRAIDEEDLNAVSRLLEAGIPPTVPSFMMDPPSTALHHAIERRNPQIVAKLLEAGAIEGLQDHSIVAEYLNAALVCGSATILSHLLHAGAAPNNASPLTPLQKVLQEGQANLIEMVWVLLQAGANPNGCNFDNHDPPLWLACCLDSCDIVTLLLDYGAEPNKYIGSDHDQNGDLSYRVPLRAAIESYSMEVAFLLLAHGARVDYLSSSQKVWLMVDAIKRGQQETVLALLGAGVDPDTTMTSTLLQIATDEQQTKIVSILLSSGAHPDLCGADTDETPLCRAAANSDLPVVDLLLAYSADPDASRFEDGSPPIVEAAKNEAYDIICALIRAEVDVNADNGAALHKAIDTNNLSCIQLLLSNGANPNLEDRSTFRQRYPIVKAARKATLIVSALVDAGADVNASHGTALHEAVERGDSSCVELLLSNKADPDSNPFPAPIVKAALCDFEEIVSLLIDHGARVSYGDDHVIARSQELQEKYAFCHKYISKRPHLLDKYHRRGKNRTKPVSDIQA